MFSSGSSKPYTAVSVHIDRMTSEQYEEEDISGIIDLIEVIKIQSSGPTEAARAIRKKLKYGSAHRQIRALIILDGLMQNAGSRFQKTFADEPLLERLRIMPRDDMVDPAVRQKCNVLFREWAVAYQNTPGMSSIVQLHKQLPQARRRPQQRQTKSLRETEVNSDAEREHVRASPAPTASAGPSRNPVTLDRTPRLGISKPSKKSTKNAVKFNLQHERPQIMQTIAQASIASTNLLNALKLINREVERVSENPEVINRFETCKTLRRSVLRYIQLVESDELIGSLLSANDELVKALMAHDVMDRSVEDDSDSDGWENPAGFAKLESGTEKDLAGLRLSDAPPPKPARPAAKHDSEEESDASEKSLSDEEDEDNPFGDSNAVKTPGVERAGMTWKTV